jgi:hypothetical protein
VRQLLPVLLVTLCLPPLTSRLLKNSLRSFFQPASHRSHGRAAPSRPTGKAVGVPTLRTARLRADGALAPCKDSHSRRCSEQARKARVAADSPRKQGWGPHGRCPWGGAARLVGSTSRLETMREAHFSTALYLPPSRTVVHQSPRQTVTAQDESPTSSLDRRGIPLQSPNSCSSRSARIRKAGRQGITPSGRRSR